jgi:hypothetical protein
LGFALQLEQAQVAFIEFIESVCLGLVHGVSSFSNGGPELGKDGSIHRFGVFFRRVAASFNNGIKSDGKKPPRLMPADMQIKT